jgi:hypothetical protein
MKIRSGIATDVVFVLALLCAGCTNRGIISEGVVTERVFIPEHTVVEYNVALKMPMRKSIPDEYKLTFEKDTTVRLSRTVTVSRHVYESYAVGDSIKTTVK